MITGKVLKARGWKEGRTIGLAKRAAQTLAATGQDESTILERLDAVLADPAKWTGDPIFFEVASEIISRERNDASKWADALRETALPYQVWGAEGIDRAANAQMENALRLPVAVAGALMPDAHVGYGLPIGGVLATQGTVIPYAVGVDIACRMRLSIYDVSPNIMDVARRFVLRIQQPYSGFWQRTHWMVARSGLMGEIPSFAGQRTVIHHRNFQQADNRPENLEWMGDGDHSRLHRALIERNAHWQSPEFEARRIAALGAKARTEQGHAYFAKRGSDNLLTYWREDYERAKANCAGNGERGKPHLIARNQSEAGRAKSREIANRIYLCETCGAEVRSPIGLHNHRKAVHFTNHKVVRVTPLEAREDVYCLSVPMWENFALAAGAFVHNCRMRLSIYDVSPNIMGQHKAKFEKSLVEQTRFGPGAKWGGREGKEHPVLDDDDWRASRFLHSLRGKATGHRAAATISSSGASSPSTKTRSNGD